VPVTPKIGRLTFDDAAKDLLTDYKVNGKRSLEHVTRRVDQHLKPTFGGRRMAGITTTDVRAYIDKRQEEYAANASINRELAALKRMYSLAIQAGKLLHRPHIPMLREDNVRQGFFERPAFESMRAHLPADVQPIATFAYLTGWRVQSEVLPLTWGQVDRAAGIVRLEANTTKNGDGRVFDYSGLPDLVDLFTDLWAAHEAVAKTKNRICPWVFNRAGKQIKSFKRSWETACEAAGCPGRIPHDLRRTAVRNLVRAGVQERVAMKVTGHKTRSVFDRYDITSPGDLREAGAKLYEARNATGTITGTVGRSGTQTGTGTGG
jgi:integrase